MPRGKRKAKRRIEEAYYAFAIEDWDWNYSFGVGNSKWAPERAYADSRHLHVEGTFSHPHKSAGKRVKLTFIPSDDLLGKTAHLYKQLPDTVGSLNWTRNASRFEGVLSIPDQSLPLLLPMLHAARLKYLQLVSNGPFRGRLDVRRYEFLTSLTADHFPEGQF